MNSNSGIEQDADAVDKLIEKGADLNQIKQALFKAMDKLASSEQFKSISQSVNLLVMGPENKQKDQFVSFITGKRYRPQKQGQIQQDIFSDIVIKNSRIFSQDYKMTTFILDKNIKDLNVTNTCDFLNNYLKAIIKEKWRKAQKAYFPVFVFTCKPPLGENMAIEILQYINSVTQSINQEKLYLVPFILLAFSQKMDWKSFFQQLSNKIDQISAEDRQKYWQPANIWFGAKFRFFQKCPLIYQRSFTFDQKISEIAKSEFEQFGNHFQKCLEKRIKFIRIPIIRFPIISKLICNFSQQFSYESLTQMLKKLAIQKYKKGISSPQLLEFSSICQLFVQNNQFATTILRILAFRKVLGVPIDQNDCEKMFFLAQISGEDLSSDQVIKFDGSLKEYFDRIMAEIKTFSSKMQYN